MTAELDDIIRVLGRGEWEVWKKVRALNGARLVVRCCCNSEQCQRVKVIQIDAPSAVTLEEVYARKPGEMPAEIVKILDACRTSPSLETQVAAYNRSRFDLNFTCEGRSLVKWEIGDA